MTDLHDLAPLYAIDALDGDELVRFEQHFGSCERCRAAVAETREATAWLDDSAPIDPPPDLRDSVIAAVASARRDEVVSRDEIGKRTDLGPPTRTSTWRRSALAFALAAAIVLIAGVAVTSIRDDAVSIDDVFRAPDAMETALVGADGTIQAIWSPGRDQVGLASPNLESPGPDSAYALWFLRDGGVSLAGLFRPDENGVLEVVLDVDDVDTNGFGVTVEPDTGSEQPTTDVIYAGTFVALSGAGGGDGPVSE